jgi:hypothetical protein
MKDALIVEGNRRASGGDDHFGAIFDVSYEFAVGRNWLGVFLMQLRGWILQNIKE